MIDATSGTPIANATVTVSQYPLGSRSVQADAAGEFVIDRLPAATLSLGARDTRKGNYSYSGGRYGQRGPDSAEQPFELAAGEHATGVELRLWRNAVISGRVTDAKGAAIPGVTVQVMRLSTVNGVRKLRSSNSSQTDVTGRYRVNQVWPGTYGVAIAATAADGYYQGGGASAAFAGYPTTFYPAASSADGASLFNVNAGEERDGVDFTLSTGSLVSVEGTVEGLPPGARSPVVELCSVDLVVAKAAVRPDGRFRFPRVPPGSYVLRTALFPTLERVSGTRGMTQNVAPGGFGLMGGAVGPADAPLPLAPVPTSPTLWVNLPVTIPNGDVTGLTLTLRPAGRIHGQVEFTGTSPRPSGDQLLRTPVVIMGVEGREFTTVPVSRIEADGRLSTVGLPPGKYGLMVMTGAFLQGGQWDPAWRQESLRLGDGSITSIEIQDQGKDVSGVVITFSDARPTELSGVVRDGTGRVRPDATIYAFSVNRQDWPGGAREVRPGRSGRYVLSSLPPREYFLAAVTDEATELWREIAFLEKLSLSAERVTLAPAEIKVVNLSVR